MKPYFVKKALLAGVVLLSAPALLFAQKEKAKDKGVKENVQQVIITRKGDKDEKTVIEIKGDKVTVNGKDASKDDNVTVHLNNLTGLNSMQWKTMADQDRMRDMQFRNLENQNFNFDFDDDHVSLFTEDANRAMLGVLTDEDDKGAKITSITRESGAEKAGLKVGDVITKVGDDAIDDANDVAKAVRQHKPGDKVKVSILRDGKEQTLTAELGKWKGVRINNLNATIAPMGPMSPNRTFINIPNRGPKLGLSVQDTDDGKGVKVLSVADESNAAKAGIKKDDVITRINDDEVNTTDEVVEAMRDAHDEPSVKLEVLREGKPQTIEVRIPRKLKTTDL